MSGFSLTRYGLYGQANTSDLIIAFDAHLRVRNLWSDMALSENSPDFYSSAVRAGDS
jgi:hypothetical protein